MSDAYMDEKVMKAVLSGSDKCLPLEALAGGAVEAKEHLAGCARCRNELALMQEFLSAEPRPQEVASVNWIRAELGRRSLEVDGGRVVLERKSIWAGFSSWLAGGFTVAQWRTASVAAASLLVVV